MPVVHCTNHIHIIDDSGGELRFIDHSEAELAKSQIMFKMGGDIHTCGLVYMLFKQIQCNDKLSFGSPGLLLLTVLIGDGSCISRKDRTRAIRLLNREQVAMMMKKAIRDDNIISDTMMSNQFVSNMNQLCHLE